MEKINYVDMGNGVLWATSNITRTADGSYKLADNPEDYGCYFSWGDVVGHNSEEYNDGYTFSSRNYSSGASGSGHNLTTDIPSGDATYDAATATLGENWRMPTYEEFKWLVENCGSIPYRLNGVHGQIFINCSDSSKTLFFPAAGFYGNKRLYENSFNGSYWSTTYSNDREAYYLDFDSIRCCNLIGTSQYDGLPIRPIKCS